MKTEKGARLVSLDQFRGYTVAGMFLVNFCGYASVPMLLRHHNSYCSYADTIMPQFLFAVGFAFRMTYGQRAASEGIWSARVHLWRRLAGLALVALVVYTAEAGVPSWEDFSQKGLVDILSRPVKRDWFQTLMHIAVTSLWVTPVIERSAGIRVLFALASLLAHALLSWWFNFSWVNADPVGIDGGPLGFLTWTTPVVAGTVICDIVRNRSSPVAVAQMIFWGLLLMGVGYLLSCPTRYYDLRPPARGDFQSAKLASSPVVFPWREFFRRPSSDWWAEPPFVPPPPADIHVIGDQPRPTLVRPWNYWMMSQRAGTPSYLVFSTGFSITVYAIFFVFCDGLGARVGVFRTLGTNALIAYILHPLVAGAIKRVVPGDAPLAYVLFAFAIFFWVTYALIRQLERQNIFIKG